MPLADEGGISMWLPGLFGSLAAAPQMPGWAVNIVYYHSSISAEGSVAAAREVTIGKLNPTINVNLDLNLKAGGPSVERFRIHFKGMVGSSGWLDGFPEVGRRRGPWRRRWAKDLLDASATGENNSLRHGAACQRLCKNRNRAATQPSL
jgi:hypothetical protein